MERNAWKPESLIRPSSEVAEAVDGLQISTPYSILPSATAC